MTAGDFFKIVLTCKQRCGFFFFWERHKICWWPFAGSGVGATGMICYSFFFFFSLPSAAPMVGLFFRSSCSRVHVCCKENCNLISSGVSFTIDLGGGWMHDIASMPASHGAVPLYGGGACVVLTAVSWSRRSQLTVLKMGMDMTRV